MKHTLLLLSVGLIPLWASAVYLTKVKPNISVPKTVQRVETNQEIVALPATVTLTRMQVEKMYSAFGSSNPADIIKFETVVEKKPSGNWEISPFLLSNSASRENIPMPKGDFCVIDVAYIDHSGDFKSCIDYANSYKDHHEYVVLSAK